MINLFIYYLINKRNDFFLVLIHSEDQINFGNLSFYKNYRTLFHLFSLGVVLSIHKAIEIIK